MISQRSAFVAARIGRFIAATAPLLAIGGIGGIGCGAEPGVVAHPPLEPHVASVCPLGGCAAPPAVRESHAPREVCVDGGGCESEPTRVCDAEHGAACTARGLELWAATQSANGLTRVEALFERACSLGDREGCHFAGRLTLDGVGVPKNVERGEGLLDGACDQGSAISCDVLARHFAPASGDGDPRTPSGASEQRYTIEAQCLRNDASSCFQAGVYFGEGTNAFPKSLARGAAAYARGCALGHATSCNNLANAYYYGDGVGLNLAKAAELYIQSCDDGEPVGCANVGFIAEYGDGVPQDLKRAEQMYAIGCRGGSSYACLHAEMLEEYKRGLSHDPARAVAVWQRGCDANDSKACTYLGVMLEDGKGAPRDEVRSMERMRRACSAGNTLGCRWVREHGS